MPQKGIWGSNPQLSASLTWKGRPPGRPFSVLEEIGDSNPGECGAESTRERWPAQHARRGSAAAVRHAHACRNLQLSASLTWKGRPPGRPFSVLEEIGDSNPGECGAESTRERWPAQHARRGSAAAVRHAHACRNLQLSASLTWKGRPPGRPFSFWRKSGIRTRESAELSQRTRSRYEAMTISLRCARMASQEKSPISSSALRGSASGAMPAR